MVGIGDLMKQAQQMQANMQKIEAETLAANTLTTLIPYSPRSREAFLRSHSSVGIFRHAAARSTTY